MARNPSNTVALASPERGVDGRTVFTLARQPTMADGRIGDFCIDTVTKKLYGPKTAAGWQDNGLIKGDEGWTPVLGVVADGSRRVQRVIDWFGGAGTKPDTGAYVGATGFVTDIADATDYRGPEGPQALIDGLDAASDVTYESLTAVAETGNDNTKAPLKDVLAASGQLTFATLAEAQAAVIPARVSHVHVLDIAAVRRRATSEPASGGKHRSTDRFLPSGAGSDSANGGWWEDDSVHKDVVGGTALEAVEAAKATELDAKVGDGAGYMDAALVKASIEARVPEILVDTLMLTGASYDQALSAAIDIADVTGSVVTHRPGKVYLSTNGVSKQDKNVRIAYRGAKVLRTAAGQDQPVLKLSYSFETPRPVVAIAGTIIYAGYPSSQLNISSNFANGQTVTIAERTYTMVTALSGADQVRIGDTAQASLDNLVAAINGGSGAGVAYGGGTWPHARVAAKRISSSSLRVTAYAIAVPSIVWTFSTTHGGGAWSNITGFTSCARIQFSESDLAALAPAPGDKIKLVSDDLIPWGTGVTDNERLAEIFEVAAVEGVNIYLMRELRVGGFMSTNIRAAKMTKCEVSLEDPWYEDAEGSPLDRRSPLLQIEAAVNPKVWRGRCERALGTFIWLRSCVEPETYFVHGENLRTSLAEVYNSFGYVVLETGCVDGYHLGLSGRRCRHVYTTGADDLATVPSSEILRYGGTIGSRIINGDGNECEHYGFDTHADAAYVQFENCSVQVNYRGHFAGTQGFQLRGWRCRLKPSFVYGPAAVNVRIFEGLAEHVIDVDFDRLVGSASLDQIINILSEATNSVRPRVFLTSRMRVDGFSSPLIASENCDVVVKSLDIDWAFSGASTASPFYLKNSYVEVDDMVLDLTRGVGTFPRICRMLGDGGRLYVRRLRLKCSTTWVAGDFGGFSNGEIILGDVECDVLHTSSNGGFTNLGSGSIGWANVRGVKNSFIGPRLIAATFNAGGAKSVTWAGRGEEELLVVLRNNTAGALAVSDVSPPVHANQRLTIMVHESSTAGMTLQTTTANISIAANVTLSARQSRRFFAYNGVWQAEQ
jgi:hypothetical protein